MAAGCTFDNLLRASRGFKASKRWPEVSNAYKRPVLRMDAPIAKVLPPAPAQKSHTISPRLASSNKASNCEPSSCTSTAPRENKSSCDKAGLPWIRKPQGENGVGVAWMPVTFSSFCTSSRLSVKVLTRKSKGAEELSCATKGQNPSPTWAFKGSTNHSGRLCRWRSNKSEVCTLAQASNQAASCLLSAPNKKSSGLLLGLAWRFCAACLAAAYLAAEGFKEEPPFV